MPLIAAALFAVSVSASATVPVDDERLYRNLGNLVGMCSTNVTPDDLGPSFYRAKTHPDYGKWLAEGQQGPRDFTRKQCLQLLRKVQNQEMDLFLTDNDIYEGFVDTYKSQKMPGFEHLRREVAKGLVFESCESFGYAEQLSAHRRHVSETQNAIDKKYLQEQGGKLPARMNEQVCEKLADFVESQSD